MDDRSRTTTAMLTELADAMRDRVVDGIRIHDARAVLDWGAGDDLIVRLTVIIDDAPPELDSWPLDALASIERVARHEGYRIGIEEWVYVRRRRLSTVEGGRLRHRDSR
jgi:hypothetical protein